MHAQLSPCRGERCDSRSSPAAHSFSSLPPEPRNRTGATRPQQSAALPRRCSVRTACAPQSVQSSWAEDSGPRGDARWQRPLACLATVLMSGAVPAPSMDSTSRGYHRPTEPALTAATCAAALTCRKPMSKHARACLRIAPAPDENRAQGQLLPDRWFSLAAQRSVGLHTAHRCGDGSWRLSLAALSDRADRSAVIGRPCTGHRRHAVGQPVAGGRSRRHHR